MREFRESYVPRPIHIVLMIFGGCGMMGLATLFESGLLFSALIAGGAMFWLLALLVGVLLMAEQNRIYYETITEFAEILSRLPQEGWNALGLRFPTLRIRYSGEPILFLEDSNIRMEDFRRFMLDSNAQYISPLRNWNNSQAERERWTRIRDWLLTMNYIYPDDPRGPKSWLWRGDMERELLRRYVDPSTQFADLSRMEADQ